MKRSNGEGSIYQRSPGRWVGQIRIGAVRRSVYGPTRQAVADQLAQLRHEALVGMDVEPSKETVEEYLTNWLTSATHLRPSTAHLYRTTIRVHVLPVIGPLRLQKVKAVHLKELLRRIEGKPRAAERTYRLLHKAFGDAVKLQLLSTNPIRLLTVVPSKPKKVTLWTLEQMQAFLVMTAQYEHWYDPLWLFMLGTGCRIGEALALQEKHVDWTNKTVSIEVGIAHVGNTPYESDPKTEAGIRTLTLPPFAYSALVERRRFAIEGYLFRNTTGGIPLASDIQRRFAATCFRLGLPRCTPHSLRRMHATLAVARGVDVKTVQHRLGHSTLAMTLGLYAQVMAMGDSKAADAIQSSLVVASDTTPASGTPSDATMRAHAVRSTSAGRQRRLARARRRHTPVQSETATEDQAS